jgi:hypothetical protein
MIYIINMFDLSGVIRDARVEKLGDFIGLKSCAAEEELQSQLKSWQPAAALKKLSARNSQLKQQLLSNDSHSKKLNTIFNTLAIHERDINNTLTPPTPLEQESYGQLFFMSEHFKSINQIPFFLSIWWFLRMYAFPVFTFLMPIIAIIGPYIFTKYIMKMPICFNTYFKLVIKMYVGQTQGQSFIENIKLWVQTAVVLVSMVQSMWQPISNAIHLMKIRDTVLERAEGVQKYLTAYDELRTLWKLPRNPIPPEIRSDSRRLTAFCFENKTVLKLLLRWVARAEIAYRFAVSPKIVSVKWTQNKQFFIENTCDIGIPEQKQKPFSVSLSSKSHALLTGPNRGGKSTVLRSIMRTLLLAHTYGVVIADRCEMSYLDWIQSSLRIEDLPGSASLFEREVTFAAESLNRPGYGFVLIDELFHSTNPSDAIMASNIYLKQLWNNDKISSIISTHVFKLVDDAPNNIERLCCPAEDLGNGIIDYKYGLEHGICKISSVMDILIERGLCVSEHSAETNPEIEPHNN